MSLKFQYPKKMNKDAENVIYDLFCFVKSKPGTAQHSTPCTFSSPAQSAWLSLSLSAQFSNNIIWWGGAYYTTQQRQTETLDSYKQSATIMYFAVNQPKVVYHIFGLIW